MESKKLSAVWVSLLWTITLFIVDSPWQNQMSSGRRWQKTATAKLIFCKAKRTLTKKPLATQFATNRVIILWFRLTIYVLCVRFCFLSLFGSIWLHQKENDNKMSHFHCYYHISHTRERARILYSDIRTFGGGGDCRVDVDIVCCCCSAFFRCFFLSITKYLMLTLSFGLTCLFFSSRAAGGALLLFIFQTLNLPCINFGFSFHRRN